MQRVIPRFQGKAIEKDGGWTFEFLISMFGQDEGERFSCTKIYPTREEAIKELKITIQDAIKMMHEHFPELGINPETYIDVKTNSMRRWDRKDEN